MYTLCMHTKCETGVQQQQQLQLQRRCRFTAPPGNVKFLHYLAVHSGLQGKETHKQQVLWEQGPEYPGFGRPHGTLTVHLGGHSLSVM